MVEYFHIMMRWQKSNTFSEPFIRSSLPPNTKILYPRISFMVRTTDIYNHNDIYYRTCADGSFMIEGVDFIISYSLVSGILSLCTIIAIASAEGFILFVLNIYNVFQNTIITSHKYRVHIIYYIYT